MIIFLTKKLIKYVDYIRNTQNHYNYGYEKYQKKKN